MLTNEGSSCEEEVFRACKPFGEAWVWQHPCELAMPERWHCSAMRLQQSRSAAVIVAPGTVHAITGRAASNSARIETPADRKSTRLNSSHGSISYAVFCLK